PVEPVELAPPPVPPRRLLHRPDCSWRVDQPARSTNVGLLRQRPLARRRTCFRDISRAEYWRRIDSRGHCTRLPEWPVGVVVERERRYRLARARVLDRAT